MNQIIKEIILSKTNSSQIFKIELIQNLWNNYGSLSRITLDQKKVILKLITFPEKQEHPKGWNSDISHKRKVKSYQVEMNWYKYNNQADKRCYSPLYIGHEAINNSQILILEDLSLKGFSPSRSLNNQQVQLSLKWLANFHARHLGHAPNKLWKTGTYWHLETRPDELKALTDEELKQAAPLIDRKLNSAEFKTFVHGDAKADNFLFNDIHAAAVDFQYIGTGVGIKDVAYFLSSIYNESELFKFETQALNYYFDELKNALTAYGNKDEYQEIKEEWTHLYPYAWADFYRFLKGWSPEHFKINSYSEQMTKKVLNDLK